MKRRQFIAALGSAAVAWPLAARAQQAAVPVIGFLSARSPDESAHLVAAFWRGLAETGFIENQNVVIEHRWALSHYDQLAGMAAELVHRPVVVLIAVGGDVAARAAAAASRTIPVITAFGVDPVGSGLVASLARPGGNVTGINILTSELAGKRLELLHELVPRAARVAVLVNPANVAATETLLKDIGAAARAIGLQIQIHNANTSTEIDVAFETMSRERPDAMFVTTSNFFNGRRVQLTQLATFHRLPASYGLREYAEAGGLMSYGTNIVDGYRQVGIDTGRILNGAKPTDLPVVQSSKIELVINAQTARMLGLTVPPTLLSIADEVIE
jgi:putative tryptophan/tyrosine transport system substrate-binding protein